jgi:hypothetical protein
MSYYKVHYQDKWILVHTTDEDKAKYLGLTLLQFKYPKLKEVETDDLIVEEVLEGDKEFGITS